MDESLNHNMGDDVSSLSFNICIEIEKEGGEDEEGESPEEEALETPEEEAAEEAGEDDDLEKQEEILGADLDNDNEEVESVEHKAKVLGGEETPDKTIPLPAGAKEICVYGDKIVIQ